MRHLFILFAVTALIWSGLHAGPAEAHENDPAHWAEDSHHAQDQDSDSDRDANPDQHGCHHHCPTGTTHHSTAGQQTVLFANDVKFASLAARLRSIPRAPPLDPPKS